MSFLTAGNFDRGNIDQCPPALATPQDPDNYDSDDIRIGGSNLDTDDLIVMKPSSESKFLYLSC